MANKYYFTTKDSQDNSKTAHKYFFITEDRQDSSKMVHKYVNSHWGLTFIMTFGC